MTSKKEFMKFMGVTERTVQNWLKELCGTDEQFVKENIQKGGYNNRELFFTDELVKKLQWIASKNMLLQGAKAGTGKLKPEMHFGNEVGGQNPSEVIKNNTLEQLEIGAAANAVLRSGSVEAAEQFAELLVSRTREYANKLEAEKKAAALLIENDELRIQKEVAERLYERERQRTAFQQKQLNFHRRHFYPYQLSWEGEQ